MIDQIEIPDIYFDAGALVVRDGAMQFNPDWDYIMFRGGRGRAGSWTMTSVAVMMAMAESMTILVLRQSKTGIRDSVWQLVRDTARRLDILDIFIFTEKYIALPNGSRFIYDHMHNNSEGIKSKEGIRLTLGEECQEFEKSPIQSLKSTIMRDERSQFVGCMNPIDGEEPAEKWIVEDEDCLTVNASYLDNYFAPKKLVRDAEKMKLYSIEDYNNIYLGLTNTIKKEHVFRAKCVQEYVVPIAGETMYYGIDWGFAETGDPTTFVVTSLRGDDIIIHEAKFFYDADLDIITSWLKTYQQEKGISNRIYSDSADTVGGKHLKKNGFNVSYSWGKDLISDRVRWFRAHRRIVIDSGQAEMWSEAQNYKFPVDKRTGQIIPKPKDENNHGWDAAGYSFHYLIKRGIL